MLGASKSAELFTLMMLPGEDSDTNRRNVHKVEEKSGQGWEHQQAIYGLVWLQEVGDGTASPPN